MQLLLNMMEGCDADKKAFDNANLVLIISLPISVSFFHDNLTIQLNP